MSDGKWWFCLTHRIVEPYDGCKSDTRLGPYQTYGEAAGALERAAQRNIEWDEDPRFTDPEDEDDDMEGWGPFRH